MLLIFYNLAWLLRKENLFDEAVERLLEGLDRDPYPDDAAFYWERSLPLLCGENRRDDPLYRALAKRIFGIPSLIE